MDNPKVSIIIPVYNGEKYLKETIESCVKQNYENIEIVIIDDCSNDNSENIALSFKNSKIRFSRNKSNLGINKTVNNGIKSSEGDYVLGLGQDDILPYDHITNMINEFDDETAFIYCNSTIIDSYGEEKYVTYDDVKQAEVTRNIKFYLSKSNIISSTGLIINKKKFMEVGGFDPKLKNYGEWLLWVKLLTKGGCKYSTSSKVYYRKHETNITNSFSKDSVKKELNEYFNCCHKFAYKHFFNEFSLKEKINVFVYHKFQSLKLILRA